MYRKSRITKPNTTLLDRPSREGGQGEVEERGPKRATGGGDANHQPRFRRSPVAHSRSSRFGRQWVPSTRAATYDGQRYRDDTDDDWIPGRVLIFAFPHPRVFNEYAVATQAFPSSVRRFLQLFHLRIVISLVVPAFPCLM